MTIQIKRNVKRTFEVKKENTLEAEVREALLACGEGDGFRKPPGIQVSRIRRIAEKLNKEQGLNIKIETDKGMIIRKKTPKLNHFYEDVMKPKIWDFVNEHNLSYCFQCGSTFDLTLSHRTNRTKTTNNISPHKTVAGLKDWREWGAVAPICMDCHIDIEKMSPMARYILMNKYLDDFIERLEAEGVDYGKFITKLIEKEM